MQLKLNLEGIDLIIGISNYVHSTTWDDDLWTDDYVSISGQYINYEINGESLECFEVERLKNDLKTLLDGKKPENTEIEFIEPDLEINFYPSHTLRVGEDGYDYIAPGHEFVDCSVELVINLFLKGALSGHSIRLSLDRGDIEKIYNYLRLVTKEIDKNNPIIVEYIEKGIMLDFQR